ncbi:biliverdin-producing heme oxygenase [Kineococcus rhizosphaerae]|uniref:Heme oxygenase n=1 Tax=Kineococcus rhizosphaerae TaxID=559628 RepID=A0A2T0R313_9ACTN|nr:biliverdin-producing heme oxygenase [Kineococcus rhizosphaerae]PRY14449.1 heme oxygenase [Kineococcus rhizosphaerae]
MSDVPVRRRDPEGTLARLRAATTQAHHDLDSSLGVLDRPWDLTRHRRWLELTWGLFAPLERALAGWAAQDPGALDVRARARADLALADLRALGVPAAELDALTECPGTPAVPDRATALGVCYVLDGSTLGGRLIAEAVVAAGVPATATTSLTGREGAGRRWRDTTAAVEAAGPDAVPALVAAALATFSAYRTWLAPLELQAAGPARD